MRGEASPEQPSCAARVRQRGPHRLTVYPVRLLPLPPCPQACHTQELANLLWAFAALRHRPPARWLAAAAQQLHARADTLCAQVRATRGCGRPHIGPTRVSSA